MTSKHQEHIVKLYSVPKIHKQKIPIPYRLVMSNSGIRMFGISKWVNLILQPICNQLEMYLTSSGHLIYLFEQIDKLPKNCYIFVLDTKVMFTNIPIKERIKALKELLES